MPPLEKNYHCPNCEDNFLSLFIPTVCPHCSYSPGEWQFVEVKTLGCPVCFRNFDRFKWQSAPDYCPLCGAGISERQSAAPLLHTYPQNFPSILQLESLTEFYDPQSHPETNGYNYETIYTQFDQVNTELQFILNGFMKGIRDQANAMLRGMG